MTCVEDINGNLWCALDTFPYSNAPAIPISGPRTQPYIFLLNLGRIGGEMWGSQISMSTFYLGLNFSMPTLGLHFLVLVLEVLTFLGKKLAH